MSTMDILKAEIAKKRKQIDKLDVVSSNKKFFKRGDLQALEEAEYLRKLEEKQKLKPVDADDVDEISSDSALKLVGSSGELYNLPREEVKRRLREKGQPSRLFGESDPEALTRLQRCELETPELARGWENDFNAALARGDDEDLDELLGKQQADGRHDIAIDNDDDSMDIIMDRSLKMGGGDVKLDCDVVVGFFNLLLTRWAKDLNGRPEEEKRSAAGKMARATHTQTVEYLKPLFRKLRNATIQADIREHLVNITKFMLDRDYILANNAYMEMAIGNAPWPVGVTASGIHKRPGNEKFYVRNVAHVLNDETQRKYIQALKRLMTRCQSYYPTDPSKCVEYVRKPEEHS